jgi:hypothetical protein
VSSSFTLKASSQFPVGTSVAVYPYFDQSAKNAQPAGTQVTTGTVASDGTVTFGGLAADTNYVAAANLSQVVAFPDWRWMRFRTNTLRDNPIYGVVAADGGRWGDAFTVTKTGTGTYQVLYDTSFDSQVSVAVTPQDASVRIATINTSTQTRFTVTTCTTAGTAVDTLFHFHARPVT